MPPQTRLDFLRSLSELQSEFHQEIYSHLRILLSSRIIDVIVEAIVDTFGDVPQIAVAASDVDLRTYITVQFRDRVKLREARRYSGLVEELRRNIAW